MNFSGIAAPIVAVTFVLALCGCQTTAQKSARLAGRAGSLISGQRGVFVSKADPEVKILRRLTLRDGYGGAAVVEYRNDSRRPLVAAPISIDVTGRDGKSIFKNDAAGLEPALTTIAAAAPRSTGFWVYDQLPADGGARGVGATIGRGAPNPPKALPRIVLRHVRFAADVDGPSLRGVAVNDSGIEQRKLVIYALARRAGRVVAAGRGQILRLAAHGSSAFQLFLIGSPRGAAYSLTAPPTVVR